MSWGKPKARMPGQAKPGFFRVNHVPRRLLHTQMAGALARVARSRGGKALTVVDAGCGTQPYRRLVEYFGCSYVGIDIEETITSGYAPEDSLRISPDGTWPLGDGSVDVAISTQVIEHVHDVGRYLQEAKRVLRPGGHLLLSTHGNMVLHGKVDLWRWTHQGLRSVLSANGFHVVSVVPILTSCANLLLQFSRIVMLPLVEAFHPVKPLYGPINVLMLLLDRTGRKSEDALPNMLLAEAVGDQQATCGRGAG